MPEAIVTRILRLPGYGVTTWDADDEAGRLTLWVRQAGGAPGYICGVSRRDVHSWWERRVRDLPWGTWQVWLVVDVHRIRCRRCGVRTERIPGWPYSGPAGDAPAGVTRARSGVQETCFAPPTLLQQEVPWLDDLVYAKRCTTYPLC